MATILRVKRKTADLPLDTLVIACKRQKTENASSNPDTQLIVEFAGTLADPTEDVAQYMAKVLSKEENRKGGVKRMFNDDEDDLEDILEKCPRCKLNSAQRYKIIQSMSYVNTEDQTFKDKHMTLIDVEDCSSNTEMIYTRKEEDIEDYEYDLYYAQTRDDDVVWLKNENLWVLQPECPDVESEDEDDSEDSNAESHWKNDYPDEDSDLDPDGSSTDTDYDAHSENYDLCDNSSEDCFMDPDDYRKRREKYGYPDYLRSNKELSDSDSDSCSTDEENSLEVLSSSDDEELRTS